MIEALIRHGFVVLIVATLGAVGPALASATLAGTASREDLTAIFSAVRDLREPRLIDGIPDYSAGAIEAQKSALAELRSRFDALDPSAWPVPDQVDYLIVRSELDTLDYGLRVYRAPSRNPNFYLSSISSFGMSLSLIHI